MSNGYLFSQTDYRAYNFGRKQLSFIGCSSSCLLTSFLVTFESLTIKTRFIIFKIQ